MFPKISRDDFCRRISFNPRKRILNAAQDYVLVEVQSQLRHPSEQMMVHYEIYFFWIIWIFLLKQTLINWFFVLKLDKKSILLKCLAMILFKQLLINKLCFEIKPLCSFFWRREIWALVSRYCSPLPRPGRVCYLSFKHFYCSHYSKIKFTALFWLELDLEHRSSEEK